MSPNLKADRIFWPTRDGGTLSTWTDKDAASCSRLKLELSQDPGLLSQVKEADPKARSKPWSRKQCVFDG